MRLSMMHANTQHAHPEHPAATWHLRSPTSDHMQGPQWIKISTPPKRRHAQHPPTTSPWASCGAPSVATLPTPKAAQFRRKIWSVLGMGQPLKVRRTCSAASCVANSTNPYPSETAVFLLRMIFTLTSWPVPACQCRQSWQTALLHRSGNRVACGRVVVRQAVQVSFSQRTPAHWAKVTYTNTDRGQVDPAPWQPRLPGPVRQRRGASRMGIDFSTALRARTQLHKLQSRTYKDTVDKRFIHPVREVTHPQCFRARL